MYPIMTKHKIQLVLMPLFKRDEIALMTVTMAKINKALTTPIVLILIMSILQLGWRQLCHISEFLHPVSELSRMSIL